MPTIRQSLANIDAGFAGQLVAGFPLQNSTTIAATVGRTYAIRFVASKSRTITKINFVLAVSASTNDNCDAGIFNSDGTVLLGSAGSTAGKLNVSPNQQQLTLTAGVALQQGQVYYAAFSSSGAGGASVAMTNVAPSSVTQVVGTTVGTTLQAFQANAFPIAAPFTSGGAIGNVPVLFLAE